MPLIHANNEQIRTNDGRTLEVKPERTLEERERDYQAAIARKLGHNHDQERLRRRLHQRER